MLAPLFDSVWRSGMAAPVCLPGRWGRFIQMPAKGGGPYFPGFCAMSSASISSWLARPLKLRAMFANSVARF